jgi:hypothetical protein
MAKAEQLGNPIAQLTYALFREPNPVPLKYALSLLGLTSPKVRLPLVGLADQAKVEIAAVMAKLCDENPECIIGAMCGPKHCDQRVVAGLTGIFGDADAQVRAGHGTRRKELKGISHFRSAVKPAEGVSRALETRRQ